MGNMEIPKQLDLTDFVRIPEAGIVVRKHVAAVGTGHFVQGLIAPLGQNDGIGRLNSGQIFSVGLAAGTGDILVPFV